MLSRECVYMINKYNSGFMKKITCILIIMILSLQFSSCAENKQNASDNNTSSISKAAKATSTESKTTTRGKNESASSVTSKASETTSETKQPTTTKTQTQGSTATTENALQTTSGTAENTNEPVTTEMQTTTEYTTTTKKKVETVPIDSNGYRAIHMGGNWGQNREGFKILSDDYISWLNEINVNWVGISVAIMVDDAMDSTVERKYSNVAIPTIEDSVLRNVIRKLRNNGFNIYLTLALEDPKVATMHPVERWQLGDPNYHNENPHVKPEFWPWDINHKDHEEFVEEFWRTYTDQAEHFARIAEEEKVGMYSLGTETNRLFRTESSGYMQNEFKDELVNMVNKVRSIYKGLLTYDMHYDILTTGNYLENLWKDLDLDVIGISAYFRLYDQPPTSVPTVSKLEEKWRAIFNNYLKPLKNKNPDLPIMFLEIGYNDTQGSVHNPIEDEFKNKKFIDRNSNGKDDGEESQANIFTALYNIMREKPDLLEATFLWGNDICSDHTWENTFGKLYTTSIRNKLAEDVVKEYYSEIANK
jgi:hypothetical protein